MMKKLLLSTFLLSTLMVFNACDSGSNENPCENNFDQKAMFMNMANNLIVPAFTDLKTKVDAMSTASTAFTMNPNTNELAAFRTAWFDAYLSWQSAAQYNFGPATEVFLRSSVNNFPLNIEETDANIQSESYDFNLPDAFDKGFPALDYLLYGIGANDTEILEKFTTASDASKYIQYVTDLVTDIKTRVDHTYDGWTTGGYDETFNNNTGTAAGTSLSLVVNHLNENYELIKREKIGIPSGILTLNSTNPTKTEAYFSGRSLELVVPALEATRDFYLGGNGIGLDDFLTEIDAKKSNDEPLNEAITDQFAISITNLSALSGKLSDEVDDNPTDVASAYNALSAQLINVKTDLPSVLCVSITYIDNPSDSD
jgi:predicted lipoprotein